MNQTKVEAHSRMESTTKNTAQTERKLRNETGAMRESDAKQLVKKRSKVQSNLRTKKSADIPSSKKPQSSTLSSQINQSRLRNS